MRKIILMMSVSVDGFFETADRDPDLWRNSLSSQGSGVRCPSSFFSRTLTQAGWNTTVIHGVVPEQIAELKAQPGGDIALSGANLASSFMRHGLIDEFRILVHPVVLGQGRPLFEAPGVRMDSGSRERGRSATAWFCSTTRATAPKGPTLCAAPSNLLGWSRTSKN
jgi:hypothetical protein